jgi:hypothetical protein
MSAKVAPEDGAVGAAKMGKKKKEKKGADDKKGAAASAKTRKGDEDPFGKPDEYPTSLALGPKQFVEFHERADPSVTLATYMEPFQEKLLPREQVMCFQQLIVFNQMVGRMIDTTAKFAYETDYNELLNKLCAGVKKARRRLGWLTAHGSSALCPRAAGARRAKGAAVRRGLQLAGDGARAVARGR